ncbi:MAG: hypothetical protein WDO19_11410 [Bacteroidota bacterium]
MYFQSFVSVGYPPRDFLEFHDFVNKCYASLDIIRQHTDTIGVIVGSPARNLKHEGKDLFNAAFLLYEKEIKAEIHKTLLPNYDVFDEYRYFEPAYHGTLRSSKEKKLAITICEDVWNMGDNPFVPRYPHGTIDAFWAGCNDQYFCFPHITMRRMW